MSAARFMVFSGYYYDPASDPPTGLDWFYNLWRKHNFKHLEPVIIANTAIPGRHDQPASPTVFLSGNLGASGGQLNGTQPFFMPACPCVWMIAAWIAYGSQCDFCYLEQDCLAFGPWIDQLYKDLGNKQAVFGSSQRHGVATSLFLVRHQYIPIWVRNYLMEGPENVPGRIAEMKIGRMIERVPEDYARLSFPFDTDRPLDLSKPVFYAQKLTPAELLQLRDAGLIRHDLNGMPDVPVFSNH